MDNNFGPGLILGFIVGACVMIAVLHYTYSYYYEKSISPR